MERRSCCRRFFVPLLLLVSDEIRETQRTVRTVLRFPIGSRMGKGLTGIYYRFKIGYRGERDSDYAAAFKILSFDSMSKYQNR